MPFEYPISACEGVNINDIHTEENKLDKLFDLAYELDFSILKRHSFLEVLIFRIQALKYKDFMSCQTNFITWQKIIHIL